MAPIVAFVTGANRRLGLGLVKGFVAKPDYNVVAAVRDPTHEPAQELPKLPTGEAICLDAVKEATDQGVDHLDYIVANVGIATNYPFVKDVKRADPRAHRGKRVVSLYQASVICFKSRQSSPFMPLWDLELELWDASHPSLARHMAPPNQFFLGMEFGSTPRMSGSILNTSILDPGWVQTVTGNAAAKDWGIESAPDTIEKSTDGMVRVITEVTKEQYGGRAVLYTGEVQEW